MRVFVVLFRDVPGVIGRLIRWQTRSRYSHAALVFDSGGGCRPVVIEAREFRGVGRGFGLWQDRGYPPADWFRVEMTENQARRVWDFAEAQLGKGYDYTMVARFISRRQASRTESERWFCSELVFAALKAGGVTVLERTEPWEVSPGMLGRSPLLRLEETGLIHRGDAEDAEKRGGG